MGSFGRDEPVSARALAAMKAALALDDELAEAHSDAAAVKFFWGWDWEGGEAEFRRAVELDRGSVHSASHYAMCLHILRRWNAALEEYRRTLQLDPVSPWMNESFLAFLVDTGRYDLALEQFGKTIELDPNSVIAYRLAGAMYEGMGKQAEAVASYIRAERLAGKSPEALNALAAATRSEGVRGYWRKRLEQFRHESRLGRIPQIELATYYAHLGDTDAAMPLLEEAYRQRAPRLVWINAHAVWEPFRSDRRFRLLLRRMAFPE